MKKTTITTLTLATILAGMTHAQTLIQDLTRNYNVVVEGDFTADSGDVEGRFLGLGDLTNTAGNAYSVGFPVVGIHPNPVDPTRDDLILGGTFVGLGTVPNGSIRTGGIRNPNLTPTLPFGSYSSDLGSISINRSNGNYDPTGYNTANIFDDLSAESLALTANANSTGITATLMSSGLTELSVDPQATGTFIYNGNSSEIYNINAPLSATIILNVPGTDISVDPTSRIRAGFLTKVLVNYYEATSLSVSNTSVGYSVLAPFLQNYSQSGGGVDGSALLGGDVMMTNGAEFHNTLFNPNDDFSTFVQPVPEPSSVALLGLASLGFLSRRRR